MSGWEIAGIAGAGVAILGGAAIQGWAAYKTGQVMADATRDIAGINSRASKDISDRNATARTTIAGIEANAYLDQARTRASGMLFAAQLQYEQANNQMALIDLQDKRVHANWRRQVEQDIKFLTMQYNAGYQAKHLSHLERTTKIYHAAELKQEREETNAGGRVDLASLFV